MTRVLACVVAYNRASLLQRVIEALLKQTASVDVLVVDNASTDNTAAVAKSFGSRVRYFHTGKNLGGAGGFAWAVELACALDYEFAYLLDDDAIPHEKAVERLLAARDRTPRLAQLPYLVSLPQCADPRRLPVGSPSPSRSLSRQRDLISSESIAIDFASFLGVLITVDAAKRTSLPILEFFIWGDDVEYLSRLGRIDGGACVPSSLITHESIEMESASNRRPLGWKFFYKIRNNLWLIRWGLPEADRVQKAGMLLTLLRATHTEVTRGQKSLALLRLTVCAWARGLLQRKPRMRSVGELLDENPSARTWLHFESDR